MVELPSGTVTLLFTDIEASTELLKALGRDYERALSDHRNLLRRAFNLHGGQVVDREGDAFFVLFRGAKDAVGAAVEAQRALAAHPWPDGHVLSVRMGIHTGEPSISDEGVTGLAVHRAARICSAARGGQILISNATRELVEDEGTLVRDVGEARLKGFDRPERLFEIVADGRPASALPSPTEPAGIPGEPTASPEGPSEAAARSPRRRVARLTARRPKDILRATFGRRRGKAPVDHLGSKIYSMARLSPSPELATSLRAVGGALVQVAREDRDAEHLLSSLDRRASSRRLTELRNAAFLSDEGAQVADALARRIDALEHLENLRSALKREIAQIDVQANEIRADIFAARLGEELPPGLVAEVDATHDSVRTLSRTLREAHDQAARPLGVVRPTPRFVDDTAVPGAHEEPLGHLTEGEIHGWDAPGLGRDRGRIPR